MGIIKSHGSDDDELGDDIHLERDHDGRNVQEKNSVFTPPVEF